MECQEESCPCCRALGREVYELEGKLEKANKAAHDANGLAQRIVGLVEGAVRVWRSPDFHAFFGGKANELETQLFVELQRGGMTSWQLKPLLEHAIAVVAELERRGVKAFKMAVDQDGNILGPFDGGRDG